MSRRLLASFVIAAVLLAPIPAGAQAFGGAARDVPLARYQDPLCPGVIGAQLDSAQAMVSLIRENATELGLPLAAEANCEPNLIVAVLDDPQDYANRLKKDRPYLFTELSPAERRALFETPGPARVWTRVFTRSRDGMPVDRRENLVDIPQTTMMAAHSLIYVPTRRDIVSTMIMLDRRAVQGLSVRQVADYATLRALSDDATAQLSGGGESILHLFDSAGDRPAGLTASDMILLKTVYSTHANDPASTTLALADERIKAAGQP
jgi:hypothetical protein